MTHQYESEILNKLMERDGFNIPSSVPPYEAEIKAYLINQVKQAYPKLTDYEAEWLLYNYTKHLPADFPISSVSNVTEASFENVVPFAYQSAILTGNTLVNDVNLKTKVLTAGNTLSSDGYITITANSSYSNAFVGYKKVKPNTKYLCIVDIKEYTANSAFSLTSVNLQSVFNVSTTINSGETGIHKFVLTSIDTIDESVTKFSFRSHLNSNSTNGYVKYRVMMIEYQEGMENWDIPYFEGMQSVKMPVLTTTGKNVFDLANSGLREESAYDKSLHSSGFWSFGIQLEPNKDVTISRKNSEGYNLGLNLKIHNENTSSGGKWLIGNHAQSENKSSATLTTNSDGYIWFIFSNNFDKINQILDMCEYIQIEYGTVATSYEPFKSNILTVNEDVTLRGIGDVQDKLDCLTGEVTECIGVVVLDGSENWSLNGFVPNTNIKDNMCYFSFKDDNLNCIINQRNGGLSDSLKNIDCGSNSDKEGWQIFNNQFRLSLLKEKLSENTINGIKLYLQQNPITIQYQLATNSIKTVDLKCINQDNEETHFLPIEGTMHVSTSGQPIQPKLDMSVPVEATTQNLASFINLEMEE